MRGATGPALLFLRLYERTGLPALLGHAARALALDLDSCVVTASGSLEVDEGWRTMPYLGGGSAGIGLVLDDLLGLAGSGDLDEAATARFEQARTGIVRAATARLYAQPGLFVGRAGMILHLARTTAPGVPDGALAAQIDALGWYGMAYRGELAFPGNQMMRLSMDLGTGTAGCLLALGAANAGQHPTPRLPFLPHRPRPERGPHEPVRAATRAVPHPAEFLGDTNGKETPDMALLDLQDMEPAEHGHGGENASSLSLLSCVSTVSFLICL